MPTYDTTWTTPLAIYNYFPVDSNLLIPERLTNQTDLVPTDINANISSINEDNLKELNAENFYQMLQNSSRISKEEIRYLWKVLTTNQA